MNRKITMKPNINQNICPITKVLVFSTTQLIPDSRIALIIVVRPNFSDKRDLLAHFSADKIFIQS